MATESPHYTLSQDYERMRELLDDGPLLGFVDNTGNRDPVRIKCDLTNEDGYEYSVGVRGYGYFSDWEGYGGWDGFVALCRKYHLSYIVPNAEARNG